MISNSFHTIKNVWHITSYLSPTPESFIFNCPIIGMYAYKYYFNIMFHPEGKTRYNILNETLHYWLQ